MNASFDDSLRSAARGGRAIGALFFAGFGGAWLALWAVNEPGSPVVGLCIVLTLTACLMAWSWRVHRRHAAAMRAQRDTPQSRRMNRVFNQVNAVQWIAIVVVAGGCAFAHRADLLIPAVIFVIGLHFLPLARVFGYRPHYVTGAVLALFAVAYPFLLTGGGLSSWGPFGAGLVLWISAVWALSPMSTPHAQ